MSDVPEGDPTTGAAAQPTEDVMDLLAEHVPLALLLDLAAAEGPRSADILQTEGMPDDAWWVPDATEAADDASDAVPAADGDRPGGTAT